MTRHRPWMHLGRHSARLVLPSAHPGAVVSYQNDLAIPFSFGPGVGTNCGTGYQGFYVTAGKAYNVSIWARSDDAGMNLSIASGRWARLSMGKALPFRRLSFYLYHGKTPMEYTEGRLNDSTAHG